MYPGARTSKCRNCPISDWVINIGYGTVKARSINDREVGWVEGLLSIGKDSKILHMHILRGLVQEIARISVGIYLPQLRPLQINP